jgi:hypothetical protein
LTDGQSKPREAAREGGVQRIGNHETKDFDRQQFRCGLNSEEMALLEKAARPDEPGAGVKYIRNPEDRTCETVIQGFSQW